MTAPHARRLLLLAAALALAACLFDPGWPMQRERVEHVVVLDITQSMDVLDQDIDGQPASRLAYAKHALRRAIAALPCGSKVGWGVFTEYRTLLLMAPLEVCTHLDELRSTLDRIDGRMAWNGNSEVAKGLYSALAVAARLPGAPSLLFVTDGHEAPPVHARHRPAFNGKAGEVRGFVLGVGGLRPAPIPRSDPLGRPLGHWGSDDVLQVDPRSRGRDGSLAGEAMVDDTTPVPPLPGATPGSEHLSALREAYLRLLADETGLGYRRPPDAGAYASVLADATLAHAMPSRLDLRPALGAIAALALLARHLLWAGLRGSTRIVAPRATRASS